MIRYFVDIYRHKSQIGTEDDLVPVPINMTDYILFKSDLNLIYDIPHTLTVL